MLRRIFIELKKKFNGNGFLVKWPRFALEKAYRRPDKLANTKVFLALEKASNGLGILAEIEPHLLEWLNSYFELEWKIK